jgi:RimJ/RimL family protein N-acetyltransferase
MVVMEAMTGPQLPMTCIRPVQPTDWWALTAFYEALPQEDRRSRFLGYACVTPETTHRMCAVDHRDAEGFVAISLRADGSERICGHLCLEPGGHDSEELAVAVAEDCQGMGLGHRLVEAGLGWALAHHMHQVTAIAFTSNASVLRLLAGSAPGVTMRALRGGIVEVAIPVLTVDR